MTHFSAVVKSAAAVPGSAAHTCNPLIVAVPAPIGDNVLDPFSARSIIHFDDCDKLATKAFHEDPGAMFREDLLLIETEAAEQQARQTGEEQSRAPKVHTFTSESLTMTGLKHPSLIQSAKPPKLRRGQFPPRVGILAHDDANQTTKGSQSRDSKEIRSFVDLREYKRRKLERRLAKAKLGEIDTKTNNQVEEPQQLRPDGSRLHSHKIESPEAPSMLLKDAVAREQCPVLHRLEAELARARQFPQTAVKSASHDVHHHDEGPHLGMVEPEAIPGLLPAMDLFDLYEIIIKSSIALLCPADSAMHETNSDGICQMGNESIESDKSKWAPLPTTLNSLDNCSLGERPRSALNNYSPGNL